MVGLSDEGPPKVDSEEVSFFPQNRGFNNSRVAGRSTRL